MVPLTVCKVKRLKKTGSLLGANILILTKDREKAVIKNVIDFAFQFYFRKNGLQIKNGGTNLSERI